MTDARPARPRAFRLDAQGAALTEPEAPARRPVIEPQPDAYASEVMPDAPLGELVTTDARKPRTRGKRFGWGALFLSAAGALVSLALSVWLWSVVENFFARSAALGWLGAALLAVALVALLVLLAREARALMLQTRIAQLNA